MEEDFSSSIEDESSFSSDEDETRRVLCYDPSQLTTSESGPPQNGHDYLRLVEIERDSYPAVSFSQPPVSSRIETPQQQREPIKTSTETLQYRDEILDNFRLLRERIDDLRGNAQLNPDKSTSSTSNLLNLMESGQPPLVSSLIEKSQRELHQTLENLVDRCQKEPLNANNLPANWVYSILAVLREPIEPDIYSTLRQLARVCIAMRSNISEKRKKQSSDKNKKKLLGKDDQLMKADGNEEEEEDQGVGGIRRKEGEFSPKEEEDINEDDEEDEDEHEDDKEEYTSCLLIICIVRDFFGQADLK